MEAIIIAIIGGFCTAIPTVIATISSNKKSTALITYRVEQLEKKVEKHNTVVERTYHLEDDLKYVKEEIKKEKATILQKEEAIQQLKIEIQEKQEHIEGLRYLLENTDFQQIADSINKK